MNKFVFKEMFGIGNSLKTDIANKFKWSDEDMDNLAETMLIGSNEDSETPAGYTYLGQFIDHDISLDSRSDRRKKLDRPWEKINLDEIANLRRPFFDLETIYGFDEPENEGETPRAALIEDDSKSVLKLGNTVKETYNVNPVLQKSFQNDLPRNPEGSKAIIVDSRNDENLVVAQIQVAFIKFHNAVVLMLNEPDSIDLFEKARKIVIRHYQYIVLTDFLPRVVDEEILKSVRAEVESDSCTFNILNSKDIFIPLEFAVAAFRMGHSMIRNSYNWNNEFRSDSIIPEKNNPVFLDKLARLTGRGKMLGDENPRQRKHLPTVWIINWNWFFDINDSKTQEMPHFNFAKKIDTRISSFLGFFHPPVIQSDGEGSPPLQAAIFKRINSLPALDLFRGRALGIPTGQEIAQIFENATKLQVLECQQIEAYLPDENLRKAFRNETPLWFYLLAEAESQKKGETLGNIGSWIVAETFLKLLKASPYSILNVKEDASPILEKDSETGKYYFSDKKKSFGMSEMLQFIADQNTEWDELNPIRERVLTQD